MRRVLALLFVLGLWTIPVVAQNPAIVTRVQFTPSGPWLVFGSADPTSSGYSPNPPLNSTYYRTGTTEVYRKTGSGSTAWTLVVTGGGTNYQTVQDEASDLTQRAKVNFTGAGVTCADNSGASRTDCTIPGTGSGTGLVLLESHTASSSASLDFTTRNASGQSGNTFQSDYDDYQIQFVGIQPASNNVSFGYRFSSNSGSSYDSTNNYYSAATGVANGGSGASFGAASNPTTGGLLGAALSNSSSRTFEGTIYFRSVGSTTLDKSAYGTVYYTNQSNIVSLTFMGGFTVPGTAYNAIQFYMSSGNIAIGTIRIYGVTK